MNNLEELAHIIRNNVFNSQADPFDISEAQVFAYDSKGCLRVLAEHQDPYEALWTAAGEPLNNEENGIGIITVGWAAPTCNTDTAPSEHPDRRRVHLISITNRGHKNAAIITFHDKTKSEITIAEDGTGRLTEGLQFAMRIITMFEHLSSN